MLLLMRYLKQPDFSAAKYKNMAKLLGHWKLESQDANWDEYMKAVGKELLSCFLLWIKMQDGMLII